MAMITRKNLARVEEYLGEVADVGGDGGSAVVDDVGERGERRRPPGDEGSERDNAASVASQYEKLAPGRAATAAARQALPMVVHADEVLGVVRDHPVCLVRGATGCGKSTQLPSLLVADAAARGEPCRMVVAQPRRLAAMALAERVANELGDLKGAGRVCGYVSLLPAPPPAARIECTPRTTPHAAHHARHSGYAARPPWPRTHW